MSLKSYRLLRTLHQPWLLPKYGQHVTCRHLTDFTDSLTNLSYVEHIVDSPVTFLSLEYLQNKEIFYLLENIQKLIGTKHPIVEFGAQTLLGSTGTFKIHGLIVLLLAQLINLTEGTQKNTLLRDKTGILPKQRRLVEVCEMISTAFFLHDNIVNVNKSTSEHKPNMKKGNKLSLLFGDYFLATACSQLATMENPVVVESVSRAISNNVEGRFWLETIQSENIPSVEEVSHYCSLRHGALMSSCCYSTALLSDADKQVARDVMSFGDNIGQAIHLKNEIFLIQNNKLGVDTLSSYPFISALQSLKGRGRSDLLGSYSGITGDKIKQIINLGQGIEQTYEKCEDHCSRALDSLKQLDRTNVLTTNLAKVVFDIKTCKPIFTV